MFFRNDFTFGGNNGLTDFKFVLDYDVNSVATRGRSTCSAPCFFLGPMFSVAGSRQPNSAKCNGHSRQREPGAFFRLRHGELQALHFYLRGRDLRSGRSLVHPASGHYQPQRNVS